MEYEEGAKEVLRLLSLIEDRFVNHCRFYCVGKIEVDGVYFRWNPRARQIQYREGFDEQWVHAGRVFEMEIPGILLKNIETLYDACLSEQKRVIDVLDEASDTANDFGDRLVLSLSEKEDDDAGNK